MSTIQHLRHQISKANDEALASQRLQTESKTFDTDFARDLHGLELAVQRLQSPSDGTESELKHLMKQSKVGVTFFFHSSQVYKCFFHQDLNDNWSRVSGAVPTLHSPTLIQTSAAVVDSLGKSLSETSANLGKALAIRNRFNSAHDEYEAWVSMAEDDLKKMEKQLGRAQPDEDSDQDLFNRIKVSKV